MSAPEIGLVEAAGFVIIVAGVTTMANVLGIGGR